MTQAGLNDHVPLGWDDLSRRPIRGRLHAMKPSYDSSQMTSATAPTSEPTTAPRPPRHRVRTLLIALAAIVLAWIAFGYLAAPRLIRRAIEQQGAAALHRPVRVGAVKVNPFTLAIEVLGLDVGDRDGARLASWDSLRIRLAPWKVLFGDVGLAEIRLIRPFLRLGLGADGQLNLQDLVDGQPAAAPASPAKATAPALGVALDRLEILEARVVFGDATVAPPFETTLGPLTVELRDFRTRGGGDSPYSFDGRTESGETFSWSGAVHSEPLRSAGTLTFKGLKLPKYEPYLRTQAPNLDVRSGTASLSTGYALEWGVASHKVALQQLQLTVEELGLALRGAPEPAVTIGAIEVRGVDVDVLGQSAAVAEVKVSGGALVTRLERDGTINLLELSRLAPSPPSKWTWRVGAVGLEKLALRVEDQTGPRPAQLELTDVGFRIEQLAKGSDAPCPLTAAFHQGAAGTFAAKGRVRPFAAAGELAIDASGLELKALAPWLDGAAPVRIADGTLGLGLRTAFDASGKAATWTVGGDLRVDGLVLLHPTRNEPLVRWRALEVQGIDAASTGRRAAVRSVRLAEPRLRLVIFEDGTTGLGGAPAAPATTAAAAPGATTRAAPSLGPAWRTALALFQIDRGQLAYVDRSVSPPVLLSVTDLDARVTRLASDPSVRSTVDVKAKVNGSAPLTVTGTLNPLQASAYTELAIATRGVDLSPFDPYAGKHLGYGLQKGKLDLDLKYQVKDRAIAAGNVIRVDQMTLGEATHSPDATAIPVRLALALLRDRDGVILLDVPVEGRLDDPEFRLGRVIWRTVLNVLVKVATSPFSALAALVGGGQADLSLVEFAPGAATLDEAARKRIDLLVKSLAERPALALELEGSADPGADGLALRRAELDRLLRRAKAAAQKPPAAEDGVAVAADERAHWLAVAHDAAFPPPPPAKPAPGQPAPTPPVPPTAAEQEERLLEQIAVPPEALPALAAARTAAARDALLAAGIDQARLFVVEGSERATKEKGARTYFAVQGR
jgi:hypothetical protein